MNKTEEHSGNPLTQELLNSLMRNPGETESTAAPVLPKCPQCGDRYCGNGVALCTECAKGQNTTQFCGQLEAAVLAEREACADLCDSLYPPWNDPGDCAKAIRARGDK